MSNEMRVILGASSVKAYVVCSRAYRVLGIVRFGEEYGLLGQDARGCFFRVNGSVVTSLDSRLVLRAIDVANEKWNRNEEFRRINASTHAVCVSTKKHRHCEPALG